MSKVRIYRDSYGPAQVGLFATEMPDQVMSFAMDLCRHVGVIMGTDGGVDNAGRQKVAPLPAEECATRCLDIAEAMYKLGKERGHLVVVPDLNEINAEYDAKIAERVAKQPNGI